MILNRDAKVVDALRKIWNGEYLPPQELDEATQLLSGFGARQYIRRMTAGTNMFHVPVDELLRAAENHYSLRRDPFEDPFDDPYSPSTRASRVEDGIDIQAKAAEAKRKKEAEAEAQRLKEEADALAEHNMGFIPRPTRSPVLPQSTTDHSGLEILRSSRQPS